MSPNINVTVKLFAVYQEVCGVQELTLSFPPRTPVMAVLDYIVAEHPQLDKWREVTRFGVNLNFVDGGTLLEPGDEVVLIPPVSGG